MIVWLASYPRSGNTFLRITLHQLYGVRTSVVYDTDGVAERLGPELVGFEERPATIENMRRSTRLHFVKTHRQRDDDIDEQDMAVCLVRDGREALVSWARQRCEQPGLDFHTELQRMLTMDKPRGTSGWGRTVLSWLNPPAPHRAVLRYEDLIQDPHGTTRQIMQKLGLDLDQAADATVPSFADLHEVDPLFFRRGHTGTYRDELPEDLHRLFWSQPANAEAMALLGLRRSPASGEAGRHPGGVEHSSHPRPATAAGGPEPDRAPVRHPRLSGS